MALVLADRVRETTTTAGTGTITLLGAVPSCQSFAAVGNGNTTYYTIVAYSGTEWEVGIGTYTASGTTLSRDTVLSSSNSGSLVNFSAGTKDVFVDYPAGRAVYEDAAGNVDGYPITGGTINNTTIGATTPSTGVFTTLTATGQTSLGGAAGSEGLRVLNTASAVNYLQTTGAIVGSSPNLSVQGSDTNIDLLLSSKGTSGTVVFRTNGTTRQAQISHTASAVNYVQVTGGATGGSPVVSAQGSDANVGLAINSKGAGTLLFQTNGTTRASINSGATFSAGILASGVPAFVAAATAGQVNYLQANGSATGGGLQFQAIGSDTNISQVFQSKGTGAIDLAAGSSGVNISNGGTVTAITRTANGTGYTSKPTMVISAPTTAGGVQAIADFGMFISTVSIVGGGTGYTAGDVLSVSGGTFTTQGQLTVSTVSAGVITAVTVSVAGIYSVLTTNPISVTGGTGSGATFNVTAWGLSSSGFVITNAGSGYVEQPTVTFSGGGGSGAAAYATVGSGTTIKSIGATLDLSVDNTSSQAFRFYNSGGTGTAYWSAASGSTSPFLYAQGSANVTGRITSNGTGALALYTGGGAQLQFNVSHTASAVNYVQVTGAATGGVPIISSQGSDTNVQLRLVSKGSQGITFFARGGSAQQFSISSVNNSVNYLVVDGAAAGTSPILSAQGTDTNIDLTLTPKGTGLVRFGTYTAGAPTATGYISIKAADGTTYKVLVGT
jgi:hypothetical protein